MSNQTLLQKLFENFTNLMQIICYIHNKSTCSNKESNLKHTICFLFRMILIDGSCLRLKWYGIEILLQFVLQFMFPLKVSFRCRSTWISFTVSWTSQQYSTAHFKRDHFGFLSIVQITKRTFWLKVKRIETCFSWEIYLPRKQATPKLYKFIFHKQIIHLSN